MEEDIIYTGDPLPPPPKNTIMAIDDKHVISLEAGEIDPYMYNENE